MCFTVSLVLVGSVRFYLVLIVRHLIIQHSLLLSFFLFSNILFLFLLLFIISVCSFYLLPPHSFLSFHIYLCFLALLLTTVRMLVTKVDNYDVCLSLFTCSVLVKVCACDNYNTVFINDLNSVFI